MSQEDKKDDAKDQINLKVKDQVRFVHRPRHADRTTAFPCF
jgi:hypothetical protein